MAREIHVFMQHMDDQGVLLHLPIEYNVGLIFVPSELRREFISHSPPERILSKCLEAVTPPKQIWPRRLPRAGSMPKFTIVYS